jgi:serine/threonine protein kinase
MPRFPRVGDVFGRYRIDAQIGQGGMGVVFSATDTAFDRRVALKVVSAALGGSAEFLARFEREAALLARLNSPHVIALFDYGIARTDSEGLTAPGSVSGTWSYLAPECGTGAPGTVASDLYALGCLLWATLTGQAPFRGTDVEIAIAHQRAPVPRLAADDPFTRHVNAILANTLAKDPRARYADADAVRADLLAAAAIPSTGVTPVPTAPPGRPPVPLPTAPPGSTPDRISLRSPPPGSPLPPPRRRRTALVVTATCLAVLAGDLDADGLDDVALRELIEPKQGKGAWVVAPRRSSEGALGPMVYRD